MDRRQKKTRAAIIAAFNELLKINRYNDITIQQIIDLADIGRSTFYAHFETKDMLLISISTQIFEHIFDEQLPEERLCSGETSSLDNLRLQLSHILFHLKESDIDIQNILKSEGHELFISHYRKHIELLISKQLVNCSVPKDFLLNYLTEGFLSSTSWWLLSKNNYTPEEISGYYIKVIEKIL